MIRKDKLDNSQLIIRERAWIKIALSFLIIASLIGVVLRFGFVTGLPDYLKFRYLMHAHSHVAMMGWLFSGLYVMIVSMFKLYKKLYRTIFWGIQISVVGMLLSFPVQGYGAISISFTVLHLILSYIFIIHAAKDIRKQQIGKPEPAVIMLMTAFMFMFISTLGTWALGPLMLSSWKGGAVYYAAVQFFLHFQFNGWFIFAMLGLLFKLLSDLGIQLPYNIFKIFYRLLVTSCILTYALAITWSTPDNFIFWTNSLGAILQFVALLYFLQLLWKILPEIKEKLNAWTQLLWSFALVCFIVKMFIQTFVAVPALAKISYTIHNFVIGFIHLIMLGVISTFLFGLFHERTFQRHTSGIGKVGLKIFILGVISTECLLFGQGLLLWLGFGFIPYYYLIIAIASSIMPIGLFYYFTEVNSMRKLALK